MDISRKNDLKREQPHVSENLSHHQSNLSSSASHLMDEGKKMASDMYESGVDKMHDAQNQVKTYSDEMLRRVQANPLSAILIAGSIGFILSSLLRK